MVFTLYSIAVICIIYYFIIIAYSGIATSFSFVWILLAAMSIFAAMAVEFYKKAPKRLPLYIPVSAATLCVTGIIVFIIVEILIFIGAATVNEPNLDYVIVLGAKIKEDELSLSLKHRLDCALEYLEGSPDTVLVLSGGKGEDEPVTEADAMAEYLIFNGVNPKQLILERISTSTVENIAYSRIEIEKDYEQRKKKALLSKKASNKLNEEKLAEDKPLEIGVITSNFHVFRAVNIGKKWGIEDLHGIPAKTDPVLFLHLCVRECAAILKDKLMGNM